jgi:hypothetical protein
MRSLFRLSLGVAVLGILATAAGRLAPRAAGRLGLDFWRLPAMLGELEASRRRSVELDAEDHDILCRWGGKARLVDDLASGRRTLADVIAVFRAHRWVPDKHLALLRQADPGQHEDVYVRRYVLAFALATVQGKPGQEKVIARLWAEADRGTAGAD